MSTPKDTLVTILSRNIFYKQMHYLALIMLALAALVVGALLSILYFLVKNPPSPLYFATDNVGRLISITPVNQPNMTTDQVIAWTIQAAQDTYSYDFVNYRAQLQNAQKYFTDYGWSTYMHALTLSNNLPALDARKQIVMAQVVPPVQIVAQGILAGAYAWKFQIPMLITYWEPPYDNTSKNVNALNVTVIVQRQPILKSYQGLGIVQMIAAMATSPSTQPQQISNVPSAT